MPMDLLYVITINNNTSTLTIPTPFDKTVTNYLFFTQAKHKNIVVWENIQIKSNTPFIVKSSLRNAAAYLAIVTPTHYIIAPLICSLKQLKKQQKENSCYTS